MKVSTIIFLFCSFFGIVLLKTDANAPYFVSPVSSNQYYYDQLKIEVKIDFGTSTATQVAVTQTCDFNVQNVVLTPSNTTTFMDLPLNYTGICTYTGIYDTIYNVDPVTIAIKGIITIETPQSNAKVAAGSSLPVSWSFSPPQTVPSSSLTTLYCTGVGQDSSPVVQSSNAIIQVSETMYGTNCNVDVTNTGYYTTTQNVPVIVTQLLLFGTPQSGENIAITTDSIPVNFTTSGGNVEDEVFIDFSCQSGYSVSNKKFITNRSGQTLSIDSSTVGPCNMALVDYPSSYLVAPQISIDFNIQYTLEYTNLPSVLYRGQSFTIQIDTKTTVISPATVAMNLNCTSGIAQTFPIVNVNQPSTLILDAAVPLEDCYFYTVESDTYAQAISSSIPVSKVPVNITQPTSGVSYKQVNLIDLSVSTTVDPVIGTVNLQLNCSSIPGVFYALQVDINRETKFTPSPYAYGNCSLDVVDPIFATAAPTDFSIVYELQFNTVPTEIYLNQTFEVLIQTSLLAPSNLTTNLYLYCDSSLKYTWPSVGLNQLETLTVPGDLGTNTNCQIETDGAPNFIMAMSPIQVLTLTLIFVEPTEDKYIQPSVLIPVNVSSTTISDPTGFVNVTLACPAVTYEYSSIVAINEKASFDVPSDVYGVCLLKVVQDIYINQIPIILTIAFQLSFVDPPSIIYEGQVFNITIASTGEPDSSLTADLVVMCPTALYSWKNVDLNKIVTLQTPLNMPESTSCYFITDPNPFLLQTNKSDVTISNVPLKFTQPASKSFTQDELVPIEVIAVNYPNIQQNIVVSWICPNASYSNNSIAMQMSVEQEFEIPPSVFGECNLSVDNPPLGFNSPVPVSFNVAWKLNITEYPQVIYPSQSFPILIEPVLPIALATSTNVNLVCNSITEQTWNNVPFNAQVNLTVDIGVKAPNTCYLQTETNTAYVIDTISSDITVSLIEMVLDDPVADSTTIIPNPFLLLVSTPLNTSISYSATADLYCPGSTLTSIIPFTTNFASNISYTNGFFGSCTLSFPQIWPCYNPPAPITIFLKYQLAFTQAPDVIIVGKPFIVEITASGDVPNVLQIIGVQLVCQGKVIETWPDVQLSQPQTLVINKYSKGFSSPICSLGTVARDEFFVSTSSPVIANVFKSPLGDGFIIMTPQEASEYVKRIAIFGPWSDLTSRS